MDVGNCLKERRLQQGLTQEELAARVAVTRQTIIAIEKARFTPSVRLALQLAQVLQMRVEELFWIEGQGEKR